MNWVRQHNEGDGNHRKEWRANRNLYRVIWRSKVFGVTVLPAYQCCVRVFIPIRNYSAWELVDRGRPLYRTLQVAKNACEKHNDPSYKPIRKVSSVKRLAPVKACPECGISLHPRKRLCECGYKFSRSVKSMRKSAEKKAAKKKAVTKKAVTKKAVTKKVTKKKARKPPLKTCPQCKSKLHVRKATCDCGYNFPRKAKK